MTAKGENLSYQWYRNGQKLSDGGNIAGATGSTLTVSNVTHANDKGDYYVEVTDAGGTARSQSAHLTVDYLKIKSPTAPASIPGDAGGKVECKIDADYQGAVSVKWLKNGQPYSGKTDMNGLLLTIDPVKNGDEGSYTAEITAGKCKPVTSPTFTLTVKCPTIEIKTDQPLTLARGGAPYNRKFIASGGKEPYTFSLAEGNLPSGLTLNPDGSLTGTPNVKRPVNFTIKATDANGCVGSQLFTIVM